MTIKKKVLILGATSNLASSFIENSGNDCDFTIVARNANKMNDIYGTKYQSYECNLSNDYEVTELFKELRRSKIKFSSVLCAAGAHEIMPLRLYSANRFRQKVDENFFSVVNVLMNISAVLEQGASIVLISSAVTIRGAATVSAYASAKAAVEALTRSAALEFASKKVRVNAIAPGVFKSQMSEHFLGSMTAEQSESVIRSHPLGLGDTTQVSNVVEFLLSDKASWITGQTIVVDGGYSINA